MCCACTTLQPHLLFIVLMAVAGILYICRPSVMSLIRKAQTNPIPPLIQDSQQKVYRYPRQPLPNAHRLYSTTVLCLHILYAYVLDYIRMYVPYSRRFSWEKIFANFADKLSFVKYSPRTFCVSI